MNLNVLLYAVNSGAVQHGPSRRWWEKALLALTHDAVLVSCDTGFARFNGLRWKNSLG